MHVERLDDGAETSISAMYMLVTIMVMSSIASALLISIQERAMTDARDAGLQSADAINGIVSVLSLEMSEYVDGAAGDTLHVVFELPHLTAPIPETSLTWVMLCKRDYGATASEIGYTEGDFLDATTVLDDGQTAAAIDEFEGDMTYHAYMTMDAQCDIGPDFFGTLVIVVEDGRTFQIFVETDGNPESGEVFL